MKQINWILAIVSLLSLASCRGGNKEVREVQMVKTDTVRAADGQGELQYPGKVKAAEDISLAFRVSGTIRKIYVEEGARIRNGQLLAELDPTDYQVQLDATEAEYKQIKADAERVMALYKEEGTTPSANDKAVYGLKQITAKYQHHKDQLGYTKLYAPFGGQVQKRLFEEHETVGAGMPVLSVLGNGTPEVEINLPAAEYIQRERFSSYYCTFDVYPGKSYRLKPISISPKANANQLYSMRLQLVTEGQPLPSPGMNTMVTIHCDRGDTHELLVPGSAIRRPAEGNPQVFVYNPATHTVTACEVSIRQLLGNGQSLVVSEKLKPGDIIISAGVNHVHEGETVEPLPAVTETNVGGLL